MKTPVIRTNAALLGATVVICLCATLGGCGPSNSTPDGRAIKARPPAEQPIAPPDMSPNQDQRAR